LNKPIHSRKIVLM